MDVLHTGSDELCYIRTKKLRIVWKGNAAIRREYGTADAVLRVTCADPICLHTDGLPCDSFDIAGNQRTYAIRPMFFAGQPYELIVSAEEDGPIGCLAKNPKLQRRITTVGRDGKLLSGILHFSCAESTSFIFTADGKPYLRMSFDVLEAEPFCGEYRRALLSGITAEIYKAAAVFLSEQKHLPYRKDTVSEYLASVCKDMECFVKAAENAAGRNMYTSAAGGHSVRKAVRALERHPQIRTIQNGHLQKSFPDASERELHHLLTSAGSRLRLLREQLLLLGDTASEAETICRTSIVRIRNCCIQRGFFPILQQPMPVPHPLSESFSQAEPILSDAYARLNRHLVKGTFLSIPEGGSVIQYRNFCFLYIGGLLAERYPLIRGNLLQRHADGLTAFTENPVFLIYRTEAGETLTLTCPSGDSDSVHAAIPETVFKLTRAYAGIRHETYFQAWMPSKPAEQGNYPPQKVLHQMSLLRESAIRQNGTYGDDQNAVDTCVLFPLMQEADKKQEVIPAGALPCFPSTVSAVSALLDLLTRDLPELQFERLILPSDKQKQISEQWAERDVLIGGLRTEAQLQCCLEHHFYHIPADRLPKDTTGIRVVALYQSKRLFGEQSGICWYGTVTKAEQVQRKDITEIPKDSGESYIRFTIGEWKLLPQPILAKEVSGVHLFTTRFLLEHGREMPDLLLRTEAEFRFYGKLKQTLYHIGKTNSPVPVGFRFQETAAVFAEGQISLYYQDCLISSYPIHEFEKRPYAVFRQMQKDLLAQS